MKQPQNKTTIFKCSIAAVLLTLVGLNAQSKHDVPSFSVVSITDARADTSSDLTCYSQENSTCSGYTGDGVYHVISNARN